jgi:hypothetical protein
MELYERMKGFSRAGGVRKVAVRYVIKIGGYILQSIRSKSAMSARDKVGRKHLHHMSVSILAFLREPEQAAIDIV